MSQYLSDLEFIENILKNLIILNHLILILGIKINFVHRYHTRVNGIHQLTLNRTCASLVKRNSSGKDVNI